MARLNESTAPPETFDILKRRFVRQNREIARINSIQSLRIRGLESEVANLLAENVSLREQVISMGQEIDRFEAAKALQDGVYDVKAKLDAKLGELNNLVADLGALPRKVHKSHQGKGTSTSARESLQSRSIQRPRMTNAEALLGDDGKLPAIVEDKYYPRQTLQPEELEHLVEEEQDAPTYSEVREPSVCQLDTTYCSPKPEFPDDIDDDQPLDTEDGGDDFLPPTLEMRRKKKIPATQDEESPSKRSKSPITQSDPDHTMKSGSKRKFDPDGSDKYDATSATRDYDFEFIPSAQLPQRPSETVVSEQTNHTPNEKQVDGRRRSRNREPSKRKVLEPKSPNVSIGSRNRISSARLQEHKVQQKPHKEDENSKPYTKKLEKQAARKHHDTHPKSDLKPKEVEETDMKRPSTHEVSPGPLGPEKQSAESEDSTSNAPSRATRRQKSVVSYAEPNLRDKMRRPTGDFTPAVGNRSGRRSSSWESATDEANKPGGKSSRGSDATEKDSSILSEDPANSSGEHLSTVSQRKRRTLPAKGDDPFMDISHENESNEYKLKSVSRGHAASKKGPRVSQPTEDRMGSPSPSRSRQQESSGFGLGEDSSLVELETSHLNKQPSFPAEDARRVKRGQRVAARRKSMML